MELGWQQRQQRQAAAARGGCCGSAAVPIIHHLCDVLRRLEGGRASRKRTCGDKCGTPTPGRRWGCGMVRRIYGFNVSAIALRRVCMGLRSHDAAPPHVL